MSDEATGEMTKPWVDCIAHRHYDEDCDACEAEMTAKQQLVLNFQQEMLNLNNKLRAQNGVGFLETSPLVHSLKADVLVEMLFPDQKQRMAFDLNYAARLVAMMKEVEKISVRNQLLGGGTVMPTSRTNGLPKRR